ncbi:hypothetical protein J27TS7_20670 [Paenibacillus dendritiformis]|uniref:hypothetical protein n=1 Tax=Paenibacillus dendritiformis TaxID=130049 RepID=UPI001B269DAB|nr:hypothetical protein [Paenibacillus dendritiformis]GIO72553.1 hypothetical protein J27TS7_20670 [Paenibacillus dendritiformis]
MPYEAKTDWKYDDLVTEKDMNRIEQGLKDAHVPAYEPLTLNPGLQVVEVENDTPFRMGEVKGRTLVNLLGRAGACDNAELWTDYQTTHTIDQTLCVSPKGASGGSAVTKTKVLFEAEKFYLLIGKAKVGTATTASLSVSGYMEDTKTQAASNKEFQVLYKAIANFSTPDTRGINANVIGGDGVTAYFDDVRLYEISEAEYEIIVSMTPEQVAATYPYVDGITNVTNPYTIVTGGNLLPPFTDGWYALTDTHLMLISPYEAVMQISTSAQTGIHIPAFPVFPNTDYTYSAEHNAGLNIFGVESGTALVSNFKGSQVTFNTGNNTRINVAFVNGDSAGGTPGTYSIKNPILTVGTEPKPFARQQRSTLGFETELAAHPVDGSNPDTLFMGDDGLPYVLEQWGKVMPRGEYNYRYASPQNGYKSVIAELGLTNSLVHGDLRGVAIVTKYNGVRLQKGSATSGPDRFDWDGSKGNVYFTISNSDSGWGPDYEPSREEIKAYFLGWKMYDATGADYNDPTGGMSKWWQKSDGKGGRVSGTQVSTVPTTLVTDTEWQPYRLQYLKAKPTVEPVRNYELGAKLSAGSNMVEVGSGIVIRELTNPSKNVGWGHAVINRVDGSNGHLKNRVKKMYDIYRNTKTDTTWEYLNSAQEPYAYGLSAARTEAQYFDPTAIYLVTYTMLDPTLAAPISGTVAANLRGTVSELVRAVNLLESEISVIDAPVKSVNGKTGDVALTSDDVGAATRAEFNDLKKNAVGKNGDSVIEGMLSMSKADGPHLQLVGATSSFGEWYVNNERKGWFGVGNRNEPSTIRLASEKGPLVMQSTTDAVHIHGPGGVFLEGRRVVEELDLVKQSVVDGKGMIAETVNGKGGGPVSANNTFPELAAGINRISTGGYYPIWVDEKITAEYQIRNIDLVTITNPKIVIFSPLENVSNTCSFEIKNHYGVNWGDSQAYASLQMVDDAERNIRLHHMETNSSTSYSSIRLLENATFRRDLPHTVSIEKGWYNDDPLEERWYMIPRDFNFNGPIKIRLALKSAKFVGSSSYPEYIQAVLRGNIVWA